ncbi:hypothetical protein CF70_011070 [Cupriavidus sp. SK-3]|uniref:hypothetical protein n=1 Tax=Cupriavidus sp. SK-3 TaxID=1470558 RepID=UPI000448BFFF|nr:hypothetical protein [Cupriavidus sp. SK-3]KDP85903.1 hypothetical protein CF70_011070 [Cupriavidus sp. SK-3]
MIGWLRKVLPVGNRAETSRAPSYDPAQPFVVNLYDDRVVVHRPDGQREELEWDAIERVVVRVSNREPWAGPAWLILVGDPAADGTPRGCVVPLNAVNHAALVERLQAFPGFSQQKLDNALRDAAAGKHRTDANCWKRGAQAVEASSDNVGNAGNAGNDSHPAAQPDSAHESGKH